MRLNSKLWAAICKSITNILRLVTTKSYEYQFTFQARIDKLLITHTPKDASFWKTACNKAKYSCVGLHEGQMMRRKIHWHPSTYLCLVSPWQTLDYTVTSILMQFCRIQRCFRQALSVVLCVIQCALHAEDVKKWFIFLFCFGNSCDGKLCRNRAPVRTLLRQTYLRRKRRMMCLTAEWRKHTILMPVHQYGMIVQKLW